MSVQKRRARAARTRGPDIENPQNQGNPSTRGSARRWRRADLGNEHRAQMLHLARECGRAAFTIHETADVFGVGVTALYRWMAEDAEFEAAFRMAQEVADHRVERALYMKAVGYSYRSEKIFNDKDVGVVRVPTIEYVQPDMQAITYWLNNRQRDRWKHNRTEIDASISITKDEDATPRELAMAMLAVLREAVEEPVPAVKEIEHEPDQAED